MHLELDYLLIHFWLDWVFTAAWAFSSCGEQGYSSLQCEGFSLRRPLLFQSTGSRAQTQ